MNTHSALTKLLQTVAESLDITENQYETATAHYEAVGKWLEEDTEGIAGDRPVIYPQGSFLLGTVVRPLGKTDEYDIDLVCELTALQRWSTTPEQLKNKVGERLKQNKTYRAMLEEGKRCWTLHYAESTRFHMDILPAIPDTNTSLAQIIRADLADTAILITDKQLQGWQSSNPKGYAEWFKLQMAAQYSEVREVIAKSLRASVEDVPAHKVKTTLQRSVQLLKRHRDIAFQKDQDDKPASIIIATLAAHSYGNQPDLIEALFDIIKKMPEHIQKRGDTPWIPNPVNPEENFADKWREHPQRETKFRAWLRHVEKDLALALAQTTTEEMTKKLKGQFGDNVIERAAATGLATTTAPRRVQIREPSKPWGKG